MERGSSDFGAALAALRALRGWHVAELARRAGVRKNTVSDYELGRARPRPETAGRLAAALGLTEAGFAAAVRLLAELRAALGEEAPRGLGMLAAAGGALRAAARLGDLADGALATLPVAPAAPPPDNADRENSPALLERLLARGPAARRALVEDLPAFRSWALAERLCEASVEAAAESAGEAAELAGLALRIARLAPGGEAWRCRLRGWALAHLGNALRVQGDLPAADDAFRRSAAAWRRGAAGDPAGLLGEARLLDLEASLRREQRRLPEALALLDRALAVDPEGARDGHVLVIRAKTLEELGDYEDALVTLRRARPLVDSSPTPRLLWSIQFNVIVNLCHLGRFQEAAPLLPEVRDLARRLDKGLDLVRLDWLEGRVAAGLGREGEAEAAFERVRQRFTDLGMAYDTALVSLELAILKLDQGRTAEVATLATEMAWIFESQKVAREKLAALKIFCEAARREALTAEAARRVLGEVRRAR